MAIFISFIVLVSCCGCFRPLNLWLADGSAKKAMLTKSVQDYHQSLHWGDVNGVLQYVNPDKHQIIAPKIPKDNRSVQYVDCSIFNTEENEETGDMLVRVKIKSYLIPSYKVTEQIVTEEWEFRRFGGGWMLKSSELFPEL